MKDQHEAAYSGICAEANQYTTELIRAAGRFIADAEMKEIWTHGAVREVWDALAFIHGLSHSDVEQRINAHIPDDIGDVTLSDMMNEEGAVLMAAKLCSGSGVLPYYITGIMACALADEEGDPRAAVFGDYVRYYGLKAAISQFCGLDREPALRQLMADHYGKTKDGCIDPPEKIALMKRAYHGGFYNEKKYKGCAQCTLLTMFQVFGRRNDTLFQSASALAAGMALSGDGACGGYSGGIMYLGTIIGRRLDYLDDGDKDAKNASYRMAQLLRDRFIDTFGSVICGDVHQAIFGRSFCLRTNAVKEEFEAAGAHTTKCTAVIGTVCVWLAEIIYDSGYAEMAGDAGCAQAV